MRGYICCFFCFIVKCQFLGFTYSFFSSSPFIRATWVKFQSCYYSENWLFKPFKRV
ncbi:hypothetical protein HDV62DRAFT_57700 [Trichoderma sp. SZMC 28011]